jgi:multisubunit Na+/H+ antiporter MnhC subunit
MGGARDLVKILIGISLMLVGVAWYFVKVPLLTDILSPGTSVPFWRSFLVVFAGFFGVLIFLFGLVLAWLSYDEYKSK